jgi:tetratricopeptide (TPR) repeat protein
MKLATALLFALGPLTVVAEAPHPICAPPPPRVSAPLQNSDFANVRADLLNGNRQQALNEAEAILDAHPGNAEASFMIGTLLLDYGKPNEALVCFRNAQAAWPGSTDVHAGLLEAYSETGDRKDRDIERAILRGYHSDGRHPSAAKTSGIVIERFHAGDKGIEAVEYFDPQGPDHVWYRFSVSDDKGVPLGSYAFAADDTDQAAYRQQHPDVAGSTLHRFALESFFSGAASTVGTIDGAPSYDDFRTRIVGVVRAQNTTASAAAPTPAPDSRKHK